MSEVIGEVVMMRTPKLNAALLAAQQAYRPLLKEQTNPFFKSKYADLPSVFEATFAALHANGLCLTQSHAPTQSGVTVVTTLLHVSGEERSSSFWLPVTKADPQGYGAASTYGRRYGAEAMLGIVSEHDHDGGEIGKSPAIPPPAGVDALRAQLGARPSPAPAAPRAAPQAGAPSESFSVRYGNAKGKYLGQLSASELQWYADGAAKSVDDPTKANFRANNEKELATLRAWIAFRA